MSGAAQKIEMRLDALLAGLADVRAPGDCLISGLCLDSRRAQRGDLYFALQGRRSHGLEHLQQVLDAGVAAMLWEPSPQFSELPPPLRARLGRLPAAAVNGLAQLVGVIADRFYGSPSTAMSVIGVTGTDGKTSCSQFVAASLDGHGGRCGVIGTLGYGLHGELKPASHTTPDAVRVQQLLADMRNHGGRYAAMEVSSHALDQGRVSGVHFETAVLTNLSRDHLDYHGDVEAYAAAKRRLFTTPGLRHAVVNLNDAFGRDLAQRLDAEVRVIGYGLGPLQGTGAIDTVRGEQLELNAHGLSMQIHSPWGTAAIRSPLLGAFNASNLLAVLTTVILAGLSFENACAAIQDLRTVPGRVERFGGHAGKPLVVVDYAHTPKALESVLQALRAHTDGRLWCVFGCGGERDAGKRPLMGAAAQRYADCVVITDDNPRAEDPDRIIADILTGIEHQQAVHVERDRARAIAYAIGNCNAADVVLVAGKGHEDYQEVGGRRLPFSDREHVRLQLEASP